MRKQRGIFRRKGRGGWFAWVRVDGVLRQRRVGMKLRDARDNLHRIRRAGGEKPTVTVADAAERWIATQIAVLRRSPRDVANIKARTNTYLVAFLGYDRLAGLTYQRLAEYRLWLDGKGRAPRTVFHLMADLRAFLLYLVRIGALDRTPFDRGLMPRVPQKMSRPLLPDEVDAVCALPGELGFQCRLGIATGFRFSDLCALTRENFAGDAMVLVASKTGRIVRVPLEPDFASEVRNRVGRLFDRKPGSSGTFSRSVSRHSGVKGFGAHRMRHTFANRMRARGVDLYRIRDLLGHRTVVTTEFYLSSITAYDPPAVPAVPESVSSR